MHECVTHALSLFLSFDDSPFSLPFSLSLSVSFSLSLSLCLAHSGQLLKCVTNFLSLFLSSGVSPLTWLSLSLSHSFSLTRSLSLSICHSLCLAPRFWQMMDELLNIGWQVMGSGQIDRLERKKDGSIVIWIVFWANSQCAWPPWRKQQHLTISKRDTCI